MSRTDDIERFIIEFRKTNGVSPSLREIAAKEETSTSVVHYHISKLLLSGRWTRKPGMARALVPVEDNK